MDAEKVGKEAEILTKGVTYTGIVMPSLTEDTIIIKLKNGYNIGILRKNIEKINILREEANKGKKAPLNEGTEKVKGILPSKKTVSILHTGGTIASKVDYSTGGVVSRFTPEDILRLFPEVQEEVNIKSNLVLNKFSEDMNFQDYNRIAQEIKKEIDEGTDGIIVTHGTDTLHYTGAALSFMLKNLQIPVVLVGAQRSSDRPSSDAKLNLISAVNFIKNSGFNGVCICMHKNLSDSTCLILPGAKSRKMHSSRRDAFQAINTSSIAEIDNVTKKIILFQSLKKEEKKQLQVMLIDDKIKTALIKIHPQISPKLFEWLEKEGYRGIIIEGTGLGQVPAEILPSLKKLVDSGCIIGMATQTINGRIDMNVYSRGRELMKLGVIGNMLDMTPETAFIKLSFLLSNYQKEEVEELMQKNIAGEICEKTENENKRFENVL